MTKPTAAFNACDDFFVTVITGQVVAAALEVVKDMPGLDMEWMNTAEEREARLEEVCANKMHKTICRVGKALGTISPELDNFDKECGVADVSGLHTKPTIEKDVIIVVQLLQQSEVFRQKTDRKHEAFPRVHTILHIKGGKCLEDWMLQ